MLRDALNIGRCHPQIVSQVGIHQIWVLADHGVASERVRFGLVRLTRQNETSDLLVLGFFQFLRGDSLDFHLVQHAVNFLFAFLCRVTLVHHRNGKKQVRILGKVSGPGRLNGDLVLVNELAIKQTAFAARKDIRGEIERIGVRRKRGGRLETDDDRRERRV